MQEKRKYLKFLAKMECCDTKKKRHPSLIEIEDLSFEELTEIWPGWTMNDITDEYVDVYNYILEAEAKGVKNENMRIYTRAFLKNSWMTKAIAEWEENGMFETEKDNQVKAVLKDVMTW